MQRPILLLSLAILLFYIIKAIPRVKRTVSSRNPVELRVKGNCEDLVPDMATSRRRYFGRGSKDNI
jgi:hypothetical protein